jgi:hypothetical protein
MAPISRPATGAQPLATIQAIAHTNAVRKIDINLLSKLPDPTTLILIPSKDSSLLPHKLLVGSTANLKTWAALLLVDDATDILYFQENIRSETMVPLAGTHRVILCEANLFPFNVFSTYSRAVERVSWKNIEQQQAAWNMGLFVQHEF